MLRNIKDLTGFHLRARDGAIGRTKDLFFEDDVWTVRYLVADTGNWLPKKRVLISPFAIAGVVDSDKAIAVDLSKQEIEQAPSDLEDQPVSRQMEAQYYQFYGWPYYWTGPYLWGPAMYPRGYAEVPAYEPPRDVSKERGDPHLRSAKAVRGYNIQALDHEFGHVDDFVVDDHDWVIRYLIVDTRKWWPGKKVLLPPQWLSSIDWFQSRVNVDLDRKTMKRAPAFDPSAPITRDYEEELFSFYNRQPYWRSEKEANVR